MKIKPISEEEIRNNKIQGNLPNRPTQNSLYNTPMTPEEIKAALDALPLLLAKRLNEVITKANEEISLLPPITENDNEKVLTAQNGEWVAKHVTNKETLPYIFIGNSGNIDDEVTYEKIANDKFHLFYYAGDDAFVLMTPSGMRNDGEVMLFKGVMAEDNTPTATLYQLTLSQNQSWTVSKYPLTQGNNGKSAYEIALENGFVGSESEWLDSLKADSSILEGVTEADNGKFLGVKNGKAVWLTLESPLPSITAADDGKVISAENGKWVVRSPETIGSHRESVTIRGGSEGYFTEEEYAVLSGKENYIEYVIEEAANNSRIYGCYLSENTKTKKTYVSNTYSSEDGSAVYIVIHVYHDRSWYKTEKSYQCFAKPTESDNGKILEVINGHPTWVENNTTTGTREYVTLRGGNDGYLTEAELSILSSKENGIEYVIEVATNNSKIYYCHLSENTQTKKTYVSDTFIAENGMASYVIIHVETSGAWFKTQSTYKGFLTPTAADSGKVLSVHSNGAVVWADRPATVVQAPKYVNSVDEMTDTDRVYVMASTNKVWAYMNASVEQDVIVTDNIVATADNGYKDGNRFGGSGDAFSADASGYHITPLIDITKAEYQGKTIQLHLEGAHYSSTGAYETWIQSRPYGLDKSVLEARPYTCATNLSGAGLIDTKNGTISVAYNSEASTTITIQVPPTFGSAKVKIGYLRFCGKGAVADSKISITYQSKQMVTGSAWVDTGVTYTPSLSIQELDSIAEQAAALVDANLLALIGSGVVST